MKLSPHYRLSFALAAIPSLLLAQLPGALDLTFNSADPGLYIGYGAGGHVDAAVRQPDGKVIIGGYFDTYNGTPTRSLARLNSDGLIDTTFQTTIGIPYGTVNSMALQADGRVLVGGNFLVFDGDTVGNLMRLMPNGTRDTTFDVGSGFDDLVRSLALQADGKIIAAGDFDMLNGAPQGGIVRLLVDGTVDPAFATGAGFQPPSSQKVNHILLQTDGKILCSGGFYTYNGITSGSFARLNSDGTLDGSFVPQTIAGVPFCTVRQSDGRYVTGGWFVQYGGVSVGRIMRLQSNGALDASYITGTGFNSDVHRLAIQPDGQVIAGGGFTTYNGVEYLDLVRLQTSGVVDPSFSPGGLGGHYTVMGDARVSELLLEPSGAFFAVGHFLHVGGRAATGVAHLFADGTPDPLFNPGHGVLGYLYDVAVQPDGKVLGAGRVHGYNGNEEHSVFRTLPDGTSDPDFHSGIEYGNAFDEIRKLVLQPDGRILVAGRVRVGGVSATVLARLLPDGAVDTTFTRGVGGSTVIAELELQPDGKILVGGNFTVYNGTPCGYIIRLLPDGSVDTTFQCTVAFNAAVSRMALQSDGRVVCIGGFTAHSGNPAVRIARLNTDGTFDASYAIGAGLLGNAKDVEALADDRMVVIGMSVYNGVSVPGGMRLLTDGTLDPSFNFMPGGAGNSTIADLDVMPDGRLLIGGSSVPTCAGLGTGLLRMHPDGSCDSLFTTNMDQPNAGGYAVALQPDGNIIVGGTFSAWDGAGRNKIARIHGGDLATGISVSSPAPGFRVQPNPVADGQLRLVGLPSDARLLRVFDTQGRLVLQQALNGSTEWSGALPATAGAYAVVITGNGAVETRRTVVP